MRSEMMKYDGCFLALCLLLAVNTCWAQRNVYIREGARTRIVDGVSRIDYGPETVTLWSDVTPHEVAVSGISLMSLQEKDSWRAKVLPERYLSDFDYDIAFEDADKVLVQPAPEVTDESSELYDDFVAHSTWEKTVNVAYHDSDVTVTGDVDSLTVQKDGAHLTISTSAAGVKYILTGNSHDASFKLYSEKKAFLVLNGVHLTNPQGPAINSQLKKRLFIELAENTVNTLSDGPIYNKVKGEDQRGCIFAEGKICISGEGQLYVDGNKKCGISSDKYIHLLGGFVHVCAHAEKGKALYGKDQIIIGGGVLRAFADGLASKGVTSDSLLTVTGGVIKSITTGDALWDDTSQDYSSCCALKSEWEMSLSGGEIYCFSTGTGGKGVSAGTLTISDADIYVRTSGTRVPEVKTEDAHGQKVEAAASPKGIKSAGKLTINSGNVYVRCSGGAAAEGIESKKEIFINGGTIRSYCVDDGMNAEGCYIRGGDVMICSTENDGFDVSFLFMYDGLLYTVGGPVDQMGLDTDGKTFIVNGGEIVALGARNCQPYNSSQQASVLCYVKKNICGLALSDADGIFIQTVPVPDTYNPVCVLFSNEKIQVGGHYKILSYGSSFSDTPETEYEFTADAVSTTLGSFR